MLRIRCNLCGEEVGREDAIQIRLISGAYVPGGETETVARELCRKCGRNLWELLDKGEKDEAQLLRDFSSEGRGEEGGAEAPIVPIRDPRTEGRCITIARIRSGALQRELAKSCCVCRAAISQWERGVGSPDWERLEEILPELMEIRKVGCAAYCGHDGECAVTGVCYYSRYRVEDGRRSYGKDLCRMYPQGL